MAAPLATRCPACSTVFRVVPDQLRVSEGWVRCGRCAEVFDATASLVDLETGAPRRWVEDKPQREAGPAGARGGPSPGAARAGLAPPDTAAARTENEAEEGAWTAPAAEALRATAAAPTGGPAGEPGPAAPGLAPLVAPAFEDDQAAAGDGLPAAPVVTASAAVAAVEAPAPLPDAAPAAPGSDGHPDITADRRADLAEMPSFVRRAERAERWRRPRVRAALAAAALAGVALLAGQVTWAYRDLAAARFPQARPALAWACGLLGCGIEPARAIDALTVESSGLVRVERSSVYRLSVSLHNRAGIDVAVPALDLALTDTQGRLVARKVLLAADLGAASSTLGAGRELALQATLQAALPAAEPVAGYTIELFYP